MKPGAVILAGGKSSRMGCDKAWLEVDGQPLLARQIQLARELGAVEIFISGRANRDYSEFGCPVLHDRFPEAGPLAGIERALGEISSALLLVLAVDMPGLTAAILRELAGHATETLGVIPRLNGRIEPLVAIYPKTAAPLAGALLNENVRAAHVFAERCVECGWAHLVDLAPQRADLFLNWNSTADLKRHQIDSILTGSPRRT